METSREEGELSDDGEITDNSQEWEHLEDVTGAATDLEKKPVSKSGKGRVSVSHTQSDRRSRGGENVYFSKFNKINENSSYEKRGEGHFRAGPHADVDYRSGAVSRERESFRNRDSGPGGRHERDESNYRGINDYRSMGPARTVLRTRIPPPPGPRPGSSFWDRQRSLRIARSYGSMGRRPAAPILSESTRDHQYVDRQPRHFNRIQVPPRKCILFMLLRVKKSPFQEPYKGIIYNHRCFGVTCLFRLVPKDYKWKQRCNERPWWK